jgi:hypothetical protein
MAGALSTLQKLRQLKLFNEKIETLRRGRFIPQVFHPSHGVSIHYEAEKPMKIEKVGADEDATLALAATLRFFVQPRDGIQLSQIAETYESLPVEDMAKRSAREASDCMNALLDSSTFITINGERITNRRLFEVFMYGGMVHANSDKKPEYEQWMKNPMALLMQSMFEELVGHMIQIIVSFHAMNERTIQLLESTTAAP